VKIFTGKTILYIGEDDSFREKRCHICKASNPLHAVVGVRNTHEDSEHFGKWHVFCGDKIVWLSQEEIDRDFVEVNGG